MSKKENITNSERTGKKDNVSDTVNFAPKGRNSAIRRCFLLFGAKDGNIHGIGAKRQCEGAQVCAVRKPDEPEGSQSEQKGKYHE